MKKTVAVALFLLIFVLGYSQQAEPVQVTEQSGLQVETAEQEQPELPENFAFLVNGKIYYLNFIVKDNAPLFYIESVFKPLGQAGLKFERKADGYRIFLDENEYFLDLKRFLLKSVKLYVDEKEKENPDFKPPEPVVIPVELIKEGDNVLVKPSFLTSVLPKILGKIIGYDKNSGFFVLGRESDVRINFELKETEPYAILTLKCPAKIKHTLIEADKKAFLVVNARFNIDKEKLLSLESKFFKVENVKFEGKKTEFDFALTDKTERISSFFDRNFDELKIYFYSKEFYNPKAEALNKTATMLDGKKLTIRKVIIDPGHGGDDNGAVSKNGVKEKDVVLKIAYKLANELKSRGYEVVLTRYTDVYVPLKDRTGIANSNNGDVFISIHLNASYRKATGAETYILSLDGLKEVSDTVAFENRELKGSQSDSGKSSVSPVSFILWDMAQREYLKDSEKLGEFVQQGLNGFMNIRDRGVKQAPLIVLKGLDMPGILIEVGFLSNPVEETKLVKDSYQSEVVKVIADSIDKYKLYYTERMKGLAEETNEGF